MTHDPSSPLDPERQGPGADEAPDTPRGRDYKDGFSPRVALALAALLLGGSLLIACGAGLPFGLRHPQIIVETALSDEPLRMKRDYIWLCLTAREMPRQVTLGPYFVEVSPDEPFDLGAF